MRMPSNGAGSPCAGSPAWPEQVVTKGLNKWMRVAPLPDAGPRRDALNIREPHHKVAINVACVFPLPWSGQPHSCSYCRTYTQV